MWGLSKIIDASWCNKKIDTNVSIDNLVQSKVVKNLLVIVWICFFFFSFLVEAADHVVAGSCHPELQHHILKQHLNSQPASQGPYSPVTVFWFALSFGAESWNSGEVVCVWGCAEDEYGVFSATADVSG